MVKKKKSRFAAKVKKNIENRAKDSSYGFLKVPNGVKVYKPSPGTVTFDFLCYKVKSNDHPDKDEETGIATKGSLWYKYPFRIHTNVGIKNEKVVCLREFKKKCPICEYMAANPEEAKELQGKARVLYPVIPLDDKQHKPEVHLLEMSWHWLQKMIEEEMKQDEDNFDFMDPESGKSIKIRFVEDSFEGHSFAKPSRVDFVPRKEQYTDEFCKEEVPVLDDCLLELSYEKMNSLFNQIVEDEDEDDIKARKSKSKKKIVEDDEDFDYDDDDVDVIDEEDEDEDEDEVPKKKSSKKPAPKSKKKIVEEDDDDDDEDFDDDDDDFEEPEEDDDDDDFNNDDDDDDDDDDFDDDDDEEEEEPAPKKQKQSSRTSQKKSSKKTVTSGSSKEKCPSGYRFGKDYNKYDECDECEVYKLCKKAKANG
jgi:hypothetical protein